MDISIYIQGGLGNQLFQIFALISYSLEHKIPFHLPKRIFDNKRSAYWDTLFKHLLKWTKKQDYTNYRMITEPSFHYNKIKQIEYNTLLMGYYQSYKYFSKYYDQIYKLCGLNIMTEQIKYLYNFNYENTVSMHFRYGDYINLKDCYEILDYDYYFNSINCIVSKTLCNSLDILYFYEESDKNRVENIINRLKKEFKLINFKPIYHYIPDYEQLIIMSLCKHNIIANSTFSWWGAYLNNNPDKYVTYPKRWFGEKFKDKSTNDLFPNKWIKINY